MQHDKMDAKSSLIILLILTSFQASSSADDKEDAIPPFPSLLTANQLTTPLINIVSESISSTTGYQTTEEYLDLANGKCSYVVSGKDGKSTTFVDSVANLIFSYKPYTCKVLGPEDVDPEIRRVGVWRAQFRFNSGSDEKTMNLYGLSAVWHNAGMMPYKYRKTNMVFSVTKDRYNVGHDFIIEDKENNQLVHLIFFDTGTKNEPSLSLEIVQLESMDTKKVVHTFNILAFERWFSQQAYNAHLQLPAGFGCANDEMTRKALIRFPTLELMYSGALLHHSHRVMIEATASRFEKHQLKSTSTTNVELYRTTKAEGFISGRDMQLFRQKDSRVDIKSITDYMLYVRYDLDLRLGTCKAFNLNSQVSDIERIQIEFHNDLKLHMDIGMIERAFVDLKSFYFVKETPGPADDVSYIIFESSGGNIFSDNKSHRIIRTYLFDRKYLKAELDSVAIWVLDDTETLIQESYHLNVLEISPIRLRSDLARIFDISEECFLNDENMKSGKDYAWLTFTYPTTSREVDLLIEREGQLKEMVYISLMQYGQINFFRVPKVEFIFDEAEVVLRLLLLDLPSYEFLFEANKGYSQILQQASGLTQDVATDLHHCAELCRMEHCKTFSFNEGDFLCLISKKRLDMNSNFVLIMSDWTLYRYPESLKTDISTLSLASLVSQMQHGDYGSIVLPELPEELIIPKEESGLDEDARSSLLTDYTKSVRTELSKRSATLIMMTLITQIGPTVLMMVPSKFEMEHDPLLDYMSKSRDTSYDLESEVPPFHTGNSFKRYKLPSPVASIKLQQIHGLTYEQCAVACLDESCQSFSYCTHKQDCVLSSSYNMTNIESLVVTDSDCFIAQRDYLSKFNKFVDVERPIVFKTQLHAVNAAECAHACFEEDSCLAFDFCQNPQTNPANWMVPSGGDCILLDERRIYTGNANIADRKSEEKKKDESTNTCDHFSRSYLADFLRVEHTQMIESKLSELKTGQVDGKTVDQCADFCVNQLPDCSAFQFCLNLEDDDRSMQQCTMIEGSLPDLDPKDRQMVVDKTDEGNQVVSGAAKKLFTSSKSCHFFSLRADSFGARSRDLALDGMTKDEYELVQKSRRDKHAQGGLSLLGGIIVYLTTALISAALGCLLIILKERNEFLHRLWERLTIHLKR